MGGIGNWKACAAAICASIGVIGPSALAQTTVNVAELPESSEIDELEQSCEAGTMQSCKLLGDAYLEGRGVDRIPLSAQYLYERACDADLAEACLALGQLFAGEHVYEEMSADEIAAFSKACDLGLAKGCEGVEDKRRRDAQRADKLAQQGQACDAGDLQSCKLLGDAYNEGRGMPRVAGIAEILYVEACAGGLADACHALGEFYLWGRVPRVAPKSEVQAFTEACRLGSRDGCRRLKDMLGLDPQNTEIPLLMEQSCNAGDLEVCVDLADLQLDRSDDPAKLAWARSMLDGLCLSLDERACQTAVSQAEQDRLPKDDRYALWLATLCELGNSDSCLDRAKYAARGGSIAENSQEVQVLLDRACALNQFQCSPAQMLRDLPRFESQCLAGDQSACGELGIVLGSENFMNGDKGAARPLLAQACLAGVANYCSYALSLETEFADLDQGGDPARALALLEASCAAGVLRPCTQLAYWYFDGRHVPKSPERGIAIFEQFCAADDFEACAELADVYRDGTFVEADYEKAAELYGKVCRSDSWNNRRNCEERDALAVFLPDLPIQVANEDFTPIQMAASGEILPDEEDANDCVESEAIFRGQAYREVYCEPNPRGRMSTPIAARKAPWQALLWRPVGTRNLSGVQRVECGGTLIRDGWILTAAHCLAKKDVKRDGYTVRLSVSNPTRMEGLEFPILEAIPHPGFKKYGYAFDVGLIRFDPKGGKKHTMPYSPLAAALDPKSLEERTISETMKVYAYGWGWTEFEGSRPTEYLQSIPMNLATMKDCEKLTGYTDSVRKNAVLCAAGDNGAQTCFGDSGGGLFYYGDGRGPVLIGVVSAGKACGTTGLDSRYPRIANVRQWIDSEIAKHERATRGPGRR